LNPNIDFRERDYITERGTKKTIRILGEPAAGGDPAAVVSHSGAVAAQAARVTVIRCAVALVKLGFLSFREPRP
jgi:hypothetical protein